MLKDRLPESSNSADKRRPLIMVSPRDRQKRLKEDNRIKRIGGDRGGHWEIIEERNASHC